MRLLSLIVLLLTALSLQAEDAYLAEGSIVWEEGDNEQKFKVKLTHGESKKKYAMTFYTVVDGQEKTLSGEAKGSLKSGSFKAEVSPKDNEDDVLSIKGNFKSGAFKGKITKKDGKKTVAKGTLTWKATAEFAEPVGGKGKKVANFTIEGTYNWSAQAGRTHTVTAVFNETAPGKYKVDFSFKWNNKDHIYSGTAEGNVLNGKLMGTVTADDQPNRKFGFEGTATKGSFEGKHHEKKGNNEQSTGNITWKPKAGTAM